MSDLIAFATARRQARASLHGTWLDGGTLEIYDGTMPADADTAPDTQVLLCTVDLPDPAGEATDGVFVGDAIEAAQIGADGSATWARAKDALGDTIGDYAVGTAGSGAAIIIDNAGLVSGALITITSFVITEG